MKQKCVCKNKGCENCLTFDKFQFEKPDRYWELDSRNNSQSRELSFDRFGREIDTFIRLGN